MKEILHLNCPGAGCGNDIPDPAPGMECPLCGRIVTEADIDILRKQEKLRLDEIARKKAVEIENERRANEEKKRKEAELKRIEHEKREKLKKERLEEERKRRLAEKESVRYEKEKKFSSAFLKTYKAVSICGAVLSVICLVLSIVSVSVTKNSPISIVGSLRYKIAEACQEIFISVSYDNNNNRWVAVNDKTGTSQYIQKLPPVAVKAINSIRAITDMHRSFYEKIQFALPHVAKLIGSPP